MGRSFLGVLVSEHRAMRRAGVWQWGWTPGHIHEAGPDDGPPMRVVAAPLGAAVQGAGPHGVPVRVTTSHNEAAPRCYRWSISSIRHDQRSGVAHSAKLVEVLASEHRCSD